MSKSWQFLSGPGSLSYRLFDALRRGLNRRLTRFLLRHALRRGGRVLEAGSGPAYATSLLAAEPGVVLAAALDIDIDALREARRRDPGLRAVVGDLYHLPFASETFDLVWNSSTFEHLDRGDRALREMAGLVRPGGQVFIGVPYRNGPLWFQRDIPKTSVGVWLGTVFTRQELERRLYRCGLSPLHAITYFARFFLGVLARKAGK